MGIVSLLLNTKARKYRAKAMNSENTASLVSGSAEDRLSGLDPVLAVASGKTVLDIGSHDGTVAEAMALAGASRIDGCDISSAAVEKARLRFDALGTTPSTFCVADLSKGAKVLAELPFLPHYDIVCYLAVHQHLAGQMPRWRLNRLELAIFSRTDLVLARTPERHWPDLHASMVRCGFVQVSDETKRNIGPLRVYRRA